MKNLTALSVFEIARGVREQSWSAHEVTAAFLDRIRAADDEVGAFLSVRGESALAEADAVDRRVARGDSVGALAGVPVALKDNMVIAGERTTAASRVLEEYVGSYDATVVRKLRTAGAVIIGKTNLDEFAMGASTENSAFRKTRNPHDLERVPGGSSGGSAAAVAARMAPAALGSDTGGSIRQPAAFCGVVGLKPTYGAVSRFGLIAMASSLDQIGPFARNVRDAALLFDAIRGTDGFDATSSAASDAAAASGDACDPQTLTIGVPAEYFVSGIDPAVKRALDEARAKLAALGFRFKEISLPHVRHALSVYYIIMPAEVSANLARFDGIRYGSVTEGRRGNVGDLRELYTRTRGVGFGAEVRRRVLLGAFVLSAGYYDAYYAKAGRVRKLVTEDFDAAFRDVDIIFAPTTPTLPFVFGEKTDDPLAMYLADVFTTQANLTGHPAISIPVKTYVPGSGELPVGFQLIGRRFRERDLVAVGSAYQSQDTC